MIGLTVVGLVFVLYALAASRIDRAFLSAPMVFVAAGIVVGPAALDLMPGTRTGEPYLVLAELTLAVLLFADASTVQLREVEGDARLPGRLLLVGLPLTIALGTLVARIVFPSQPWAAAALIASILAPTDVALGLPVVANAAVPNRIRRALNVESGLNDGIATPFVTLFLLIVAAEERTGPANWLTESLAELGFAVVTAVVVGAAGGIVVRTALRRGWTTQGSRELVVVAFAVLSYSAALTVGGNGFVAAFLGGIFFGAATGGQLNEPTEFAENLGLFASFLVWTLFGAFLAGPLLLRDGSHLAAVAYALLSLTVIRIAPVALATAGLGLRRETVLFVGWFGPRGLASVVFLLIAIEDVAGTPVADPIVSAVGWTILLSILLHGLTARPLATAYGRRIRSLGSGLPETVSVPEPRVRRRR
jgi:NhaP-type Na+/H+ or K+/H+ antiporter